MKTLLKSTAIALALSLSFGSVAAAKTPKPLVKVSPSNSLVQTIKTQDGLNLPLTVKWACVNLWKKSCRFCRSVGFIIPIMKAIH
ncbi:hypothetical protein M2R47_08410 [Moraxella sp. Tifton1]|uniref:hypothetical protein n=1 Tax=Moraxella oculi TaxID=2940516 RepID=UPI002011FBC5|nr:hypothetical protein [Moraxella sp. Tifton1]MCL1624255.1 hypothetical protein [Moraxella sp. Tifton1]